MALCPSRARRKCGGQGLRWWAGQPLDGGVDQVLSPLWLVRRVGKEMLDGWIVAATEDPRNIGYRPFDKRGGHHQRNTERGINVNERKATTNGYRELQS